MGVVMRLTIVSAIITASILCVTHASPLPAKSADGVVPEDSLAQGKSEFGLRFGQTYKHIKVTFGHDGHSCKEGKDYMYGTVCPYAAGMHQLSSCESCDPNPCPCDEYLKFP